VARVAVGADVRSRAFFEQVPRVIDDLRTQGAQLTVVFVDAADQAIVKRYGQTRRPHPVGKGDLLDGIRREREMLAAVRARADLVVDTTNLNLVQLGELVRERFSSESDPARRMHVTLQSFGFTGGVPFDADLVLDARFIPNPYYVEALRPLTGLDAPVRRYLEEQESATEFLARLGDFLEYLLPQYKRVGKSYLTVAVGCTGGQHRSVAIVERLRERFDGRYTVSVKHRDLEAAVQAAKDAGR
ncbi:MAG: RNase adapter RapZ, partial [Candidatus Methylomirabilis sp.]|nr:RNase adapter RapZ [Deltaproteobacteria bacterium]